MRDLYSNFAFMQALKPQDLVGGATATGTTIDLVGYNGCTFIVNVGDFAGGGAMSADNRHQMAIQFGIPSAAGVSAWSDVAYGSQIITSLFSEGQALTSGIVLSLDSYTWSDTVIAFGVKNIVNSLHRYVRCYWSEAGSASTVSVGVVCLLGYPANWPVMEPMR